MSDPTIVTFQRSTPMIGADVFIADTARVIGKVEIGAGSSVWYGSVIRGDVFWIKLGERVNVQDGSVVHVTSGRFATEIGDDVTIGHRAVIHGCTIGARALIGMGAIVMDGAVIGEESIIGAGALVPPGKSIPPRVLAVGSPAKVVRDLTDTELAYIRKSAPHYALLAGLYLADARAAAAADDDKANP